MTSDAMRRWQWLAVVLLAGVLVWLLAPILTPFVISALLGWLGDPLVDRLERRGFSRGVSVVIVFATMTTALAIALLILLPMLWEQLQALMDWLPRLALWISGQAVPWLESRFRVDLAQYVDPGYLFTWIRTHWEEAGGLATSLLARLSDSGLALFALLANVALVPVLSFYFLRDWDVFVGKVASLVPRPMLPTVTRLAGESNEVLGGFLRGQLSVMVALGAIYAIGLWAVGLELGLLIGFIAGLVSFVPYLGAFVGLSAAIIATLVQHGDFVHLLLVLGVFGLGQALESFVLTPWLVGDRIGLHPVAVIFAIMAGGQLFGFLGVLLALPVAAVAMVLLRYAHQRYTSSGLYGAGAAEPDPGAPPAEAALAAVAGDAAVPAPAIPPVTPP